MLDGYAHRAFMLDISRGSVPQLPALLRCVDHLAGLGFSHFALYCELHALLVDGYQSACLGYPALSTHDLAAINARCQAHGLTFIPAIQSLGHMARLLTHPRYAHLALSEACWSLRPCEETYALLGAYYDAVCAVTDGPYLHACLDEPHDLIPMSRYSYAVACGYIPGDAAPEPPAGALLAYVRHISRLCHMAADRGRRLIIFADVFVHYPALLTMIPPSVTLWHWWYDGGDQALTTALLRQYGHEAWAMGTIHTHQTGTPDIPRAVRTMGDMALSGLEAEATGVVVSAWDDAGKMALDDVWPTLQALQRPYTPSPCMDMATRHAVYDALTGVYRRAVELAESATSMNEAERKALHVDKQRYVALGALETIA